MLVGISPVEDLFLDKFTCGQRLKWRAREIEVCLGRDGQELGFLLREYAEVFVHIFQAPAILRPRLVYRNHFILTFEQFFSSFTPSAEVILVKYHEIPIYSVDPFVLRLNIAYRVPT